MGRDIYDQVRNLIFGRVEFEQMAFVLGVAHSHNLMKENDVRRWTIFLQYWLPGLYDADIFSEEELKSICQFVEEMQKFAFIFSEATPELLKKAEEATPKQNWLSPIGFENWKFRTWDGECPTAAESL